MFLDCRTEEEECFYTEKGEMSFATSAFLFCLDFSIFYVAFALAVYKVNL